MTRVSSEPEPLEGSEFTRVHFSASHDESEFLETVNRLRRARSAWRVARYLAEFALEHPAP